MFRSKSARFFSGERRRRRSLVHIFPANSGDVPFIEGKVYFGVRTPVSGLFAGVAGKVWGRSCQCNSK